MKRKYLIYPLLFIFSQCKSNLQENTVLDDLIDEKKGEIYSQREKQGAIDLYLKLTEVLNDSTFTAISNRENDMSPVMLEILKEPQIDWEFVCHPTESLINFVINGTKVRFSESRYKHLLIFKNQADGQIKRKGINKFIIYPQYSLKKENKTSNTPEFIEKTNPVIANIIPSKHLTAHYPLILSFQNSEGKIVDYVLTYYSQIEKDNSFVFTLYPYDIHKINIRNIEDRKTYNYKPIFLKSKNTDLVKYILSHKKSLSQVKKLKNEIASFGLISLGLLAIPPFSTIYIWKKLAERYINTTNSNSERDKMFIEILNEK